MAEDNYLRFGVDNMNTEAEPAIKNIRRFYCKKSQSRLFHIIRRTRLSPGDCVAILLLADNSGTFPVVSATQLASAEICNSLSLKLSGQSRRRDRGARPQGRHAGGPRYAGVVGPGSPGSEFGYYDDSPRLSL